jgi:hypothetical protein
MKTERPDLRADPAAIAVIKKPLPVSVHFAERPGICETLEGPVQYRDGDAILTGMEGEQWPVRRETFDASYQPVPPTVSGENGEYVKRPVTVLARKLERSLAVAVGWQDDPIVGHAGDWVLQYGPDDYGIVSASIFEKTYTLHN